MKETVKLILLPYLLLTAPALADELDLRDPSLDYTYIIVAADSLCSAIQPLKEHRENDFCGNFSNSHKVILTSLSLVESQFGESPEGIRDFLTYAYHNWAATPEYVLLVGRGCYEVSPGDLTCPIPEYITGMQGATVTTDDFYVCVDGPDDIEPDIAIGRLPATTPQDVDAYVNKVLAYDLGGISRDANDNFLFLCHDVMEPNPPVTYPVGATRALRDSLVTELLAQQWNVTTLTASSLCNGSPEQCYDIWESAAVNVLNEPPSGSAPLVVGGIATVSGYFNFMHYFSLEMGFSMNSLNMTGVYPFFVGACCGLGKYYDPAEWSLYLNAAFLLEPGKGAIGWIAPSRFGIMLHTNYWFSKALYPKLRETDRTVGSAFLEAKLECLRTNTIDPDGVRNYSLLGDPALVLARNYNPVISGVSAPNAVDPGEEADLEVFFEDRNYTCCGGGGFCDEIWSIDWETELGTVVEDEGWPVVPHTATYHAPEGVSGVYDHVTATVTDKMGLTGQWVEPIYIRHSKPGCPYLFVNDGESYRRDNNISAWAYSDGLNKESSTDYYKLRIRPDGDEYLMEIRGLEREVSFLDRVSLLTVDHGDSTTVAVTRDGSLFPYQTVRNPVAAIDRDGHDRLAAISSRDELSFAGTKGDVLILTFAQGTTGLTASAADDMEGGDGGLILEGDGKVDPCEDGGCYGDGSLAEGVSSASVQPIPVPKGIVVQVEGPDGDWVEAGFMRPREHMSETVVPLSAFDPRGGAPLRVRLLWTGAHSLDYVGYVTRAGEPLGISDLAPTTAVHSLEGPVLDDVARADGSRTCIPSGEKVTLRFTAEAPEDGRKRDLVLVTDGYFTREESPVTFMQMSIPTRDMLELATPNPFRSEIAIHYAVASPGHVVDIAVFDAKGRLVKTLFSGVKPPGRYVAIWDGMTGKEKAAPAGVYFCRMSTEQRTTSAKIIRTK